MSTVEQTCVGPCPKCSPRRYLTSIQTAVNLAENMGLTEQQIIDRVTYILEGTQNT